MKKLIVFTVLLLCMNIFMCNATQIINHNSFALVEDYIKTFKASQNDVTFIFKGNGWEGKTFKMTLPKRLLGEFKKDLFEEISFNCKQGEEKNGIGLLVLNSDNSKIELEIGVTIDLLKGRYIVLYWEGIDFSIKAYKKRPKFIENNAS